jgi:hypothetical protein
MQHPKVKINEEEIKERTINEEEIKEKTVMGNKVFHEIAALFETITNIKEC